MVSINFILSLMIYSVSILTLWILFNLWRKSRQEAILWTFILIASFTWILIAQLLQSYFSSTGLVGRIPAELMNGLGISMDFISISMVYTIPRFSWSMGVEKPWRGILPTGLVVWSSTLYLIYLSSLFLVDFPSQIIQPLIYFSLFSCLLLTFFCIIFLTSGSRRKKKETPWYGTIALDMAILGLLFLPFFLLFDFFPGTLPWEWINRITLSFGAVPYFCLIWDIRLIQGALKSQALFTHEKENAEQIRHWMEEKELSPREQEVALLLIEGKNYSAICDSLCLSLATVKSHTNRIYRKTGNPNQISLIKAEKKS